MGAISVSGANLKFALMMRHFGILEDVNPHLLDDSARVVLVPCGDGDYSDDIFHHQSNLLRRATDKGGGVSVDRPKIHLGALNGGPLLLVRNSPIHAGLPQDEVLFHSIVGAIVLQKGTTIALMAHTCGAAMRIHKMTMEEVFDGLKAARDRTKTELPERVTAFKQLISTSAPEVVADFDRANVGKICVLPYMHIDWDGGKKNTYFVNMIKYDNFKNDPVYHLRLYNTVAGTQVAKRQEALKQTQTMA